MNELQKIGSRIKNRREELEMTQGELAIKAGYTSHSSIAKIEMGLIDLSQSKIKKIADILGVKPSKLLGDDNQTNLSIPEKYRDIAVAFSGGADNLTQDDIDGLLILAQRVGISVYDFKMSNKKAFTALNTIAVDCSRIDTDRELKQLLAEELGHCITKSLYPLACCGDRMQRILIDRAERKAMDYSYNLQVPLCELIEILKTTDDDYIIAEELDVSIDTLREAVEYYRRKNLL